MMFVWIKVYVMYTIYNGIQQEQIVPFSRPDDTSGTKWLSKPREGQQVPFPCIRATELPPGGGDWLTWVWSHSFCSFSTNWFKDWQKCLENFPRFNPDKLESLFLMLLITGWAIQRSTCSLIQRLQPENLFC